MKAEMADSDGPTDYGFRWGPIEVSRLATVTRRPGSGEYHILEVKTLFHRLEIYVSPTGRTVRVYLDQEKLDAPLSDAEYEGWPVPVEEVHDLPLESDDDTRGNALRRKKKAKDVEGDRGQVTQPGPDRDGSEGDLSPWVESSKPEVTKEEGAPPLAEGDEEKGE